MRGWIDCVNAGCRKPRLIYSEKKLSLLETRAVESIVEHNTFCCGVAFDLPVSCQIITTDQRLTCSSPVQNRFYNVKDLDLILVCYRCGEELDEDSIQKFNDLKLKWKTVLPACSGKCSNAPNSGWITKGETKQGTKSSAGKKRKPACSIDLSTFRPRPIEDNFDDWLADSKLAWNQRMFEIRTKRQIKRRRKR